MITAQGAKALTIERIEQVVDLDLIVSQLCDQIATHAETGMWKYQYYNSRLWKHNWNPLVYRLECLGYEVHHVDDFVIEISWENPTC